MYVVKENNLMCLWLLMFISCLCIANTRQTSYNRYNARVNEYQFEDEADKEVEASVQQINLTLHSDRSSLPSKSFPSKNIATTQRIHSAADEATIKATTEMLDDGNETTTTLKHIEGIEIKNVSEKIYVVSSKAGKAQNPYPAAGFQPKIPFSLPTTYLLNRGELQKNEENLLETQKQLQSEFEATAPYPPSGYHPSTAFLLPTEQLRLRGEPARDIHSKNGNWDHPSCGSSTNPLLPKPADNTKIDPNSEPINININGEKRSPLQLGTIPTRLTAYPLL